MIEPLLLLLLLLFLLLLLLEIETEILFVDQVRWVGVKLDLGEDAVGFFDDVLVHCVITRGVEVADADGTNWGPNENMGQMGVRNPRAQEENSPPI